MTTLKLIARALQRGKKLWSHEMTSNIIKLNTRSPQRDNMSPIVNLGKEKTRRPGRKSEPYCVKDKRWLSRQENSRAGDYVEIVCNKSIRYWEL